MNESIDTQFEEPKKSRPGFLTVLGILSFITIGLNIILLALQLIGGRASEEQMLEERVQLTAQITEMQEIGMDSLAGFLEQALALADEVNDKFYLAMSISLLTYVIGFFGVFKMWKGQKLGFHLYIIYCLLATGGMYLYVSAANVPSIGIIVNAVLSGLFIFMYSRNLHWMKS